MNHLHGLVQTEVNQGQFQTISAACCVLYQRTSVLNMPVQIIEYTYTTTCVHCSAHVLNEKPRVYFLLQFLLKAKRGGHDPPDVGAPSL